MPLESLAGRGAVLALACVVGCISFDDIRGKTQQSAALCGVEETLCDGRDDDCDDQIDEDLSRPCSTCIGSGVEHCRDGAFTDCDAPVPVEESCNGIDDDCNGAIDDGLTRACETCLGSGVETCTLGAFGGCTAPQPTEETCNEVDDNCSGDIDEGLTRSCATCRGSGIETCAAGVYSGCTAPDPITEVCNGLDDDCEGNADNGFDIGQPCDAADDDTCEQGVWQCDGAGDRMCTDAAPAVYDICASCSAPAVPVNNRVGVDQVAYSGTSMAWNGTEWGVVWQTSGSMAEVWFSRVAADGSPVQGSEVKLSVTATTESKAPNITWNGLAYGVVWMEVNGSATYVAMRRVDSAGAVIDGAPVNVSQQPAPARSAWFPRIAWEPELGIWYIYWECHPTDLSTPHDICARLMTSDMSPLPPFSSDAVVVVSGAPVQREIGLAVGEVTAGTDYRLTLAWREDTKIRACAMSAPWYNCTSQLISSNGSGTAELPVVAWNGSEFRVFWHDPRTGAQAVYSDSLSINNVAGGTDALLTSDGAFVSVAWDGSAYRVPWHRYVVDNDQVFIGRADTSGMPLGERQLSATSGHSWRPQIAHGPGDVSLVGWFDYGPPGGAYVQAVGCTP